jgi:glycosyltransferase involved in cell wall biosynthesis
VMPSTWYETFGRAMMEAFARGTPVVASDAGAMAEMVEHERTGLRFTPGDAVDLANAVQRILGDEALSAQVARCSREVYLRTFTGDANYAVLMDLYKRAIALATDGQGASPISEPSKTHPVPSPPPQVAHRSSIVSPAVPRDDRP